ncbi:short-chain dehydrogenase [Apiospora rasikravindrae]|uniref:Short-chain dehydrogenase n=1 Tax=Apiospora rasikravindrae TaxID=990691 RepID=A0ABR1SZS4_9PEZI
MASKFYAIVIGAGTGTGTAAARRFAQSYPVVLMARSPASYQDAVDSINAAGGQAVGVRADAADESSLQAAFARVRDELLPGHRLAAAVYNVGANFKRAPFLESTVADFDGSIAGNARGAFLFAQQTIPLLLESVDANPPHPPTLIITGATASMRGAANCSGFAAGMAARRALGQSLAREFGPRGVHVAHAVIDGVIDIPRTKGYNVNEGAEDGKLDPDAIAESYWHLHTQHRSAFTQELDLRPYVEKF